MLLFTIAYMTGYIVITCVCVYVCPRIHTGKSFDLCCYWDKLTLIIPKKIIYLPLKIIINCKNISLMHSKNLS